MEGEEEGAGEVSILGGIGRVFELSGIQVELVGKVRGL